VNFAPALVTEEHPFQIDEEMSAEVLALDASAGRVEKPIRIELVVQRNEENFLVTGWATTSISMVCGRCANPLPWPIRARVEHHFEAPHPNSIDLTSFVREDILLELPLNAVCQLGADGRCPVTGELYQPPPENSGTLAGEEVWEALSKIKPKKD
jgi:uncharacterized metal-binding protein YceD (DUF177 family)